MMLEEIGEYLEAQSVGTVGTDIYYSFMPDTPDVVLSLYEAPSNDSIHTFGSGTDAVADTLDLQIRARCAKNNYPSGRNKVGLAIRALDKIANATLSGAYYYRVQVSSGPFLIDKDTQDRQILAVNLDVYRQP